MRKEKTVQRIKKNTNKYYSDAFLIYWYIINLAAEFLNNTESYFRCGEVAVLIAHQEYFTKFYQRYSDFIPSACRVLLTQHL